MGDNQNKPPQKQGRPNRITLIVLVVLAILAIYFIFDQIYSTNNTISYDTFLRYLEAGKIYSSKGTPVKIFDNGKITGKYIAGSKKIAFQTFAPQIFDDGDLYKQLNGFIYNKETNQWEKTNAPVVYKGESSSGPMLSMILFNILPILILVGLFWFMFKQFQGAGNKAFTFGKSKAKKFEPKEKITFKDVAGVEEAKTELAEVVEFLKDPQRFTRIGAKIPKGILLVGPPGTGKTLMARAVAGEADVAFFHMSGSDFVEMFVGVGASRVRDLFDQGRKNAPCILFIDELDAVGRVRGAGYGGGHDEREQTLNQLLVEMDGFDPSLGVILIAATNRPDVLDPALLRPGRFDRQVVVDRPDLNGREEILKIHVRKVILSKDIDLRKLARATTGFTGADLANMVNEAALLAARFGKKRVTMADFEEARDKIIMGVARKSRVIPDKDKKLTAVHESGHTIIGMLVENSDPLHKVTIIPRGMALGITSMLPEQDEFHLSKLKILDQICVFMGGRVAEEIVFNNVCTGAMNDISRATEFARKMVTQWGMSDKLGPITYGQKEEPIFIGKEIATHKDYSDKTAEEIDEEVKDIITKQYNRAKEILTKHRDKLDLLAKTLFERETLDAEEIYELLGFENKRAEEEKA